MLKTLSNLKTKITATFSSFLSVLGISGGSTSAVCQTTCSTSSAVLPMVGVSLSATPLAFLEDYQIIIWWVAFAFLAVLFFLYLKGISNSKTDRALLIVNAGLLTTGFPFLKEISAAKMFPWIGLLILGLGIYLLTTARKFAIKFEDSPKINL